MKFQWLRLLPNDTLSLSMLSKLISTLAFLCMFLTIAKSTFASPMPPAPVCGIEGEIVAINNKVGVKKISLQVTSIYTYDDVDFDTIECDAGYKSYIESDGVSYYDTEPLVLKTGMKIKGLVNSTGDEFGSQTRLYSVEILTQPIVDNNMFSQFFINFKKLLLNIF